MAIKRVVLALLVLSMVVGLTACTIPPVDPYEEDGPYKTGMVTDTGGIDDQSFNQSAWKGMKNLGEKYGSDIEISYLESKQESDYASNLDRMTDSENELIFGIGFAMADALEHVAQINPYVSFAIVDYAYEKTPPNITGIMFRSQESSFMVGYIAAKTTKTNKLGFVGGMENNIIDQFEFGFKAGVAYAAKEMGKEITIDSQYVDSFSDAAKGKAVANKMYTSGADILFHAAGGSGIGVIKSAEENKRFVIGVDLDQKYLSPDHVLTSSLTNVDRAVELVIEKDMNYEEIGGQNMMFGLAEGAVGIPEDYSLMGKETYDAAIAISKRIISGEIVPPQNEGEFNRFDISTGKIS